VIYQHRLIVSRRGRLDKRHAAFHATMSSLDDFGSVLVGAWEVLIGADAGCALFQLRQFDSLAAWEQHQERVQNDARLGQRRRADLLPNLDFVDTAILRLADGMVALPADWPDVNALLGTPRGFVEQRTLHFRPGSAPDHHAFYVDAVRPALERDGACLVGLFDTLIGPGATNATAHRSIELRRFPDLASWQAWHDAQDTDPGLRALIKEQWLSKVERVDSVLMRALDYSRIR
jgi:hypothetical protein